MDQHIVYSKIAYIANTEIHLILTKYTSIHNFTKTRQSYEILMQRNCNNWQTINSYNSEFRLALSLVQKQKLSYNFKRHAISHHLQHVGCLRLHPRPEVVVDVDDEVSHVAPVSAQLAEGNLLGGDAGLWNITNTFTQKKEGSISSTCR